MVMHCTCGKRIILQVHVLYMLYAYLCNTMLIVNDILLIVNSFSLGMTHCTVHVIMCRYMYYIIMPIHVQYTYTVHVHT